MDNEMNGSATASVNAGELNATGQHLLSNLKDGPSLGYSTADPLKGPQLLPEININKAPVAQAWIEVEQEESDRASNEEFNKHEDRHSSKDDHDDHHHQDDEGNNEEEQDDE